MAQKKEKSFSMNYIDLTLQNLEDEKIKDSFENIFKT